MAKEISGYAPSGTLYARLKNPSGSWWNGTTFETYSAGNYGNYDISMTEEGNSGIYVADFPTAITTSGTYQYVVHRQAGGSPAEGDQVVSIGTVDWTGSVSVGSATGSMTGSDWLDYVVRQGFIRTDKDTEIYECTTDAIQEMRRRFMFDEAEAETTTTDTISTDGDFKISLETDFGLLLGVVIEDDENAIPLVRVSKARYDSLYPDVNVTSNRGFPKHFCVYAGSIYVGPIPDDTSYSYRISYSLRAGTITSSTSGVPFTSVYREILLEKVFERLYNMLEEYDKADRHEARFERKFAEATHRETVNSGSHFFQQRIIDC